MYETKHQIRNASTDFLGIYEREGTRVKRSDELNTHDDDNDQSKVSLKCVSCASFGHSSLLQLVNLEFR